MYIPNFGFLAQFGGEFCEEQTCEMIEMRNPNQKATSLGLEGVEMGLNSRDPQKAYLGHLPPNVHT